MESNVCGTSVCHKRSNDDTNLNILKYLTPLLFQKCKFFDRFGFEIVSILRVVIML